MKPAAKPDFTSVTEVPGVRASRSELVQMFTRYHWAAGHVQGRRVLELGCGSGPGLGYLLAKGAANVVGTDIEERNLAHAKAHYAGRAGIELRVADAQDIPLADGSCDVVILFEAIYYVPDIGRFLREAFRVLAPGGVVLISTVNREWGQFNPSPFSCRYPSCAELAEELSAAGFSVHVMGGFPDRPAGVLRRAIAMIRRTAVRLRLIPNTMKGKELLKRIFYGRLELIPHELTEGSWQAEVLHPLDPSQTQDSWIFLYAEGKKPISERNP